MLRNWKRNSKKYIAGILAIALTAGVCQSYGSMEAMAKEATLPGIEKLVDNTINTEGNIFHILEIVPSTENASIGYLIGGEEPVSEGRKLSELPSQTERLAAMQQLRASINSGNMSELAGQGKAFDFSAYEEKENAANTVQLRGDFVQREDGSGRYNYIGTDAVYTMLADGEAYAGTRYERYSSFSESSTAIAGKKSVLPTFSMVSGSTGNQLQTVVDQNGEKTYAYTTGRYALTNYGKVPNGRMDSIDTTSFQPSDYVGMKVWQKAGSTENPHYTYLGVVAFGSALPENCSISGNGGSSVSSGNAAGQSVSGGNAVMLSGISTQQLPGGIGQNLYILDKGKNVATLWALYNENLGGGVYSFQPVADGYFLQFLTNEAGEYYVSEATLCDGADGDWKLVDEYRESDTGRYKKVQDGNVQVIVRGENGFDVQKTYDFIGDAKADSLGSIVYNGGFENREWFKKYVLNLSDDDISKMQIEVTTLTVQELADLVEKQTYCGLELADVDMIYLSGQGSYGAEPENADYLANAVARLCFGIESDTDTAQNRNNSVRIPVVMDYQFYEKNQSAGNAVLTRLALTLLRVSDSEVYNALVKEKLNYWDETKSSVKNSDCLDNVNKEIVSLANSQKVEGADTKTLSDVREFLTENVYLNNDSSNNAKAYVASDFLTDISRDATRAWMYVTVLEEIKYENFLLQKDSSTQTAILAEEISKASVTRYILNWYLHRVMVKSQINVLDLEPCYDYSDDTDKELASLIRNAIGVEDTENSKPAIEITQMASAEFIGKIEDMNDQYDMVYIGSRTGMMNTIGTVTMYNDASMMGMIYTHVGDVYDYSNESSDNKNRLRDDSLSRSNLYRGPGNDMNSTKEKEFEQYIAAGYPVVLSDKLLSEITGPVSVNTTTVDRSSYFYQLLDYALSKNEDGSYKYWQKNVFAESQLADQTDEKEDTRRTFANLLNLSKLQMEWVTDLGEAYMPTELHYNEAGLNDAFLNPTDGKYYLQYIFALSNEAAVSQISTSYDCKLFVDKNSDGRFSGSDVIGQSVNTTEELAGLSVYVRSGQEWNEVSQVNTGNGEHYELRTGYTYKVVRALPEDYQGVLPWKLIFYNNEDSLVRTSMSGYTAVDRGTRLPIKVLQLRSDKKASNGKENWDLAADSDIDNLLKGIREFSVQLKSQKTSSFISGLVSSSDLRKMNDAQKSEAYYNAAYQEFQKYDMLILGFGDNYTFGTKGNDLANMAVSEAVRDYIESGKSILFTHDSSSYVNSTAGRQSGWYWGYEFNKTIRAEVGLDRFGALKEYYADRKNDRSLTEAQRKRYADYYEVLNTQFNYDTAWAPGTSRDSGKQLAQIEGITRYTAVRYMKNRLNALLDKGFRYSDNFYFPVNNAIFYQAMDKGTRNDGRLSDYAQYGSGAGPDMEVTQVNEGQVTNYPYQITSEEQKTIAVAATHYQWLQPNMELDKDGDGKNDIVVWYCLSDMSAAGTANKTQKEQNLGIDSSLNLYNICPKDIVNNYYIYTMGNVTYSGAGHTKPTGMAEKKLFVNTMIAAYTASVKAPSMTFLNSNGTSVDSVYMMYDRANKIVLQQESDVNVDFKANDYNILSSIPEIRIEFYKACQDGDAGAVSIAGITGKVKPVSRLKVTRASDGTAVTAQTADNAQYYAVASDAVYHLSLPLSETGMFNISGTGNDKEYTLKGTGTNAVEPAGIYAKVTTYYDNGNKKTESTIVKLSVSVADLFDLN